MTGFVVVVTTTFHCNLFFQFVRDQCDLIALFVKRVDPKIWRCERVGSQICNFFTSLTYVISKFLNKVLYKKKLSNHTNTNLSWKKKKKHTHFSKDPTISFYLAHSSEFFSFWIKNEENFDEWPTKVNENRPCFS
jgi:hypothetical protein